MLRTMIVCVLRFSTTCLLATTVHLSHAAEAKWANPIDGPWTDPANWTTDPVFPENRTPMLADTYDVFLDAVQVPASPEFIYTATLDGREIFVDSVSIASDQARLRLTNQATLEVTQSFGVYANATTRLGSHLLIEQGSVLSTDNAANDTVLVAVGPFGDDTVGRVVIDGVGSRWRGETVWIGTPNPLTNDETGVGELEVSNHAAAVIDWLVIGEASHLRLIDGGRLDLERFEGSGHFSLQIDDLSHFQPPIVVDGPAQFDFFDVVLSFASDTVRPGTFQFLQAHSISRGDLPDANVIVHGVAPSLISVDLANGQFTIVPEPSGGCLLVVGVLLLGGIRCIRRRGRVNEQAWR
jgi:hypothetical protein